MKKLPTVCVLPNRQYNSNSNIMASKSLNAAAATFTPGGPNEECDEAEATTTTASSPSFPPQEDSSDNHGSFSEYAEMVETIEDIMDEESDDYNPLMIQSVPTVASVVETGLPPHLVNHAAEFWYPESRDCTCCKGFKFGCNCVKVDRNGVCKFCGGAASSSTGAATAQAPAPAQSSSLLVTGPSRTTAAATATSGNTGFHGNQYGADFSNRPSYSTNNNTSCRPTYSGGRGYNPENAGGGGGKRNKVICKFFLSPNGCRNGGACTFEHVSQA
jgi:hypothetical protein